MQSLKSFCAKVIINENIPVPKDIPCNVITFLKKTKPPQKKLYGYYSHKQAQQLGSFCIYKTSNGEYKIVTCVSDDSTACFCAFQDSVPVGEVTEFVRRDSVSFFEHELIVYEPNYPSRQPVLIIKSDLQVHQRKSRIQNHQQRQQKIPRRETKKRLVKKIFQPKSRR